MEQEHSGLEPTRSQPTPISEAELRGLPLMQLMVRERNERTKPYRLSIKDRAKTLGKEVLFAELQTRIEERIRPILFEATGPNPTLEQIEAARDLVRDELLLMANAARAFGMHYRQPQPFRVGAVMLALRKTENPGDNPWVVLFDANTKVDRGHVATKEGEKWCAEQYLMDRIKEPLDASEAGINKVVAFAVSGEARPDDVSVQKNVKQITLTPCQICRDRMVYDEKLTGKSPTVSTQTEVATADALQPWIKKLQKVGDLHRFHKESVEID